jgi:phosphoribosylglycinamide formyltransferase 1
MRVVCLISGSGTNLQALIGAKARGELGVADLVAVISNVAGAGGLDYALDANIPAEVLSHRDFADRLEFDRALMQRIDHYQPQLVVLAGFMRILSDEFVAAYRHRLINIHPSLLPKYKGLDTHQRAIDAGETVAGASVHWVTEALDSGAIIRQTEVPIAPGDTAETLKARVLDAEHVLYPAVVRDISLGVVTP